MNPARFFTRTIGRKINFGFAIVIAILIAVVSLTLTKMTALVVMDERIATDHLPSSQASAAVVAGMRQGRACLLGYLLTGDAKFKEQRRQAWESDILPGMAKLHELSKAWSNVEDKQRLDTLDALAVLRTLQDDTETMFVKDPAGAKAENENQLGPITEVVDEALAGLIKSQTEQAQQASRESVRMAAAERLQLILLLAGGIALGVVISSLTARAIVRPVGEMVRTAKAIAHGDLSAEVEHRSEDEVGQLAESFREMIGALRQMICQTSTNAHNLTTASEELASASLQIGANAGQTSHQATVISAAADQVSKNIQTVAAGAEQMMASIREIAKSAVESTRVATNAVEVAREASSTIGKLGTSSAEIGAVIKAITSIAQQTNLLALNAAIEAARAGEAGRGFSVVANEVKELAKGTALATEDISRRIQTIQSDTQSAVAAIGEITGVIHRVNDISATIASAVEEQAATTTEMGRGVSEAAQGSTEIAHNIVEMAKAAAETSGQASRSQTAAAELAGMAKTMQSLASRYQLGSAIGEQVQEWSQAA